MTKPTNPNLSIPAGFAENGIKTNFTAEKIQTGFDSVEPDIISGDNLNKFLDDTYKGLTYATDGVQDIYREGIPHYDADETYPQNALVKYVEDEQIVLYQSLVKDNLGNEVTDENYWKLIKFSDDNSANTDLSNLSDAGQIAIGSMGMPSNKYVDLTLGENESYYTAPADGYFALAKQTGTTGQTNLVLRNTANDLRTQVDSYYNSESVPAVFLPVAKGEQCLVAYNRSTGDVHTFRFIYVKGAENEV